MLHKTGFRRPWFQMDLVQSGPDMNRFAPLCVRRGSEAECRRSGNTLTSTEESFLAPPRKSGPPASPSRGDLSSCVLSSEASSVEPWSQAASTARGQSPSRLSSRPSWRCLRSHDQTFDDGDAWLFCDWPLATWARCWLASAFRHCGMMESQRRF